MPGSAFQSSTNPLQGASLCFLSYQPAASNPTMELHEMQMILAYFITLLWY